MKYLNLGCGTKYILDDKWVNIDFVSGNENVIAYNLLNGIPFEDNSFDLVYHSHVLEHFNKEDGIKFIAECYRVLKPGGCIRIAVPDLEDIVKSYLFYLNEVINNPTDKYLEANYEWMKLEMYDQTVRNYSGGKMAKYLFQEIIPNEDFVYSRIGEEGRFIRKLFLTDLENKNTEKLINLKTLNKSLFVQLKNRLKIFLISRLRIDETAMELGKFRMGGEIHQCMYDRYSLRKLLEECGCTKILLRDAYTSFVNNWATFNLDGKDKVVRKPDSVFIEAIK